MTRCALLAGLALTGLVFAGCEGTGAGSGSAAGPASATGEGVVAVAASKAAFVRGGAEHRGVNFGNEEPLKMKGARGEHVRRIIYMGFELPVDVSAIRGAQLRFNVLSGGKNPSITHLEYTDTNWEESGITWDIRRHHPRKVPAPRALRAVLSNWTGHRSGNVDCQGSRQQGGNAEQQGAQPRRKADGAREGSES